MLDAFPLVVPTQQGRTVGTMRPVRDARYGLVILGDPRDPQPEWPELYMELALYVQSAGLSVLGLDYRQPEHVNMRAFDLLDAVSALRTQGAERVLVVSRACGELTGAFGTSAIIPSFLHGVLRVSRNVGEIAERMATLIDMVSSTVESIAGTAAIVTQAQSRPPTARHVLRQRMLDAATRTSVHVPTRSSHGLSIVAPRPGELVLRLGGEVSGERRAHLLETLYGWCMAQMGGAVAATAPARRDAGEEWESERQSGHQEALAALREAQLWLDERWIDIVGDLKARHPQWAEELADRADIAHGQTGAAGMSLLEVRHVWRRLDAQARDEWVAACSQLVRVLAATSGQDTPGPHAGRTRRQLQNQY